MVNCHKDAGGITVGNGNMSFCITDDCISLIVCGETVSELRPGTRVDVADDKSSVMCDDGTEAYVLSEDYSCEGSALFVWTASGSPIWDAKQYELEIYDDRAEYRVKVRGRGNIDTVRYFSGTDSGTAGSPFEFDTGFYPAPTFGRISDAEFNTEGSRSDDSILAVPPMFCYVFDTMGMDRKTAFGLAAEKGEHLFNSFLYKTEEKDFLNRFWLQTDQCGHCEVDGTYELPRILIYTADTRKEALEKYVSYYYSNGIAGRAAYPEKRPRFWYGPYACGWIEQQSWARKEKDGRPETDRADQKTYDNFLKEMDDIGIAPRALIIDDRWQNEYGTATVDTAKWPDLRGWIDGLRGKRGIRTMLWYKLWDAEGLPDSMRAKKDGEPMDVIDPTAPGTREHIKRSLHTLISDDPGCYNADGLKLDFAFMLPKGRGVTTYSGKYGTELMLEYMTLIYDTVKSVKPDALVSGSPCHPLFAGCIDNARLHDYHMNLRRAFEEFTFRKELYETAFPGIIIDTDGASYSSKRDTVRYLRNSYRIGVPDLYCATSGPSMEISMPEWRQIADIWRIYSERMDEEYGE